jgi:opacity protein-like surface antigen
VDWYTRGDVQQGTSNFDEDLSATLANSTINTATYDVTRTENIKYEQDTGMLNFYYDFRNTTRFTPYLGAGIGVTYRQLTRTSSEFAQCGSVVNNGVPPPTPAPTCANSTGSGQPLPNTSTITEGTETKKSWDLAAALMAGVSVQVTDSILWDTGYRYMWQNGGLTVSSMTLAGTSDITIEDIGQHQFRTGIRLDLN